MGELTNLSWEQMSILGNSHDVIVVQQPIPTFSPHDNNNSNDNSNMTHKNDNDKNMNQNQENSSTNDNKEYNHDDSNPADTRTRHHTAGAHDPDDNINAMVVSDAFQGPKHVFYLFFFSWI